LSHRDTPALDLAGLVLSAGRASRCYRALRERQLASAVSVWDYTAGDIGVFVAHAESPPEHARSATRALWRELQAARTQGVQPGEVARAQSIIQARWLRQLETMDGQATYLASWEAEGGLDLATRYYDAILSLQPQEVADALATHLDPDQVTVISYRPHGTAPLAEHESALREMLRAGAKGYLLKDSTEKDLLAAVRAVAHGKGWLSPEVSGAVLEDCRKHVSNPIDLLTPREREVLQLIVESRTNKEIATALGLSVYTVEAHRGRIMEKLNLHSIGELVRFAVRNGLID
jgi:DNA-binding CsgD family transcriptional regulator